MPSSGSTTAAAAARESRRSSKSARGGGVPASPATGAEAFRSNERREKSKNSLNPAPTSGPPRPASDNPPPREGGPSGALGDGDPEHDLARSRTNSAPHLDVRMVSASKEQSTAATQQQQQPPRRGELPKHAMHRQRQYVSESHAVREEQDDDEVAGVAGAVRNYQPFQSTQSSAELLAEINIAVIGAEGVGKSTFIQKAFGLPHLPPSRIAERMISIKENVYLVRLLELPSEDIEIEDDEKIKWPQTIASELLPRVDGTLILYDVTDKGSIEELPEMLYAITKASLPTILIACKCDTPPSDREVDPSIVEQYVKRAIGSIRTLQISNINPDHHKRSIYNVLKAIIKRRPDVQLKRSSAANRPRAQSSVIGQASPRFPGHVENPRSSSEYADGASKEPQHGRHDSSLGGYSTADRFRNPRKFPDDHRSFLWEESTSEASPETAPTTLTNDVATLHELDGDSTTVTTGEVGVAFDELVDRLLAQPTSKADGKFSAVFLALYRKFAAPGRLLEAIVDRFDVMERTDKPQMIKTVAQLRYLAVVEQWVSTYPGDFAFPRTKRRLRTFTTKLADTRIFAVAANEISADLDAVQEDDDTDWGYSDKDREAIIEQSRMSMSSTASTLIDDPAMMFAKQLNGSSIADDPPVLTPDGLRHPPPANQMLTNVDIARRQAQLLQPIPRYSVSKVLWRILMEQPDDLIAKEITRMDWLMFVAIRPRDLVRHVSLSAAQRELCKNLEHVNHMIDHFNQLANWVANFVLLRDKPKHRALMLEKFMRIARKLRELNNYNGLGAIIAGVKSTSIYRLSMTRELIPADVGKDWLKLEILMATPRSHFAYRLAWENSSNERIPYLPLHRRDLAAAEEGNKTFIDNDETMINWKKFEIMGEVVVSIQRAQGMSYQSLGVMQGHEQIKELILDVKLLKDEEDLYERSLQLEPAANAGGTSLKLKEFFKR